MANVKIYTTSYCGYCHAAVALLERKGVQFEQEDVTGKAQKRMWLAQATGRSTVPQIFINGRPVGGYTDLRALDQRGELDRLLAQPYASQQPAT